MSASFHLSTILCLLAILAFATFLTRAAIEDLFERRIPNAVCLGVVGSFFLYALNAPAPIDWLGGGIVALGIFILGIFLFSRGAMGGGDVKLMTACGLWCGVEMVLSFGLIVSLTGGILALAYLFHHWLQSAPDSPATQPATPTLPSLFAAWSNENQPTSLHPAPTQITVDTNGLPYGIAIAIGGLWVAAETFRQNMPLINTTMEILIMGNRLS